MVSFLEEYGNLTKKPWVFIRAPSANPNASVL